MSELKIKIVEENADQTAKKLDDLEKKITDVGEATKKTASNTSTSNKALEDVNKSAIQTTDNFQKMTSVAGQLGGGVAKVAGQLGTMKTAFEGATGVVAGPWGLALGGALAGLAAFNLVTEEAAELQTKLKRGFLESVEAIQSLEGRIRSQEESLREYNRIISGTSTEEERRIRLLANTQRQIEVVAESNDKLSTTMRNVWDWLERNASSTGTLRTRLELKAIAQREVNRIGAESITILEAQNQQYLQQLQVVQDLNNAQLTARGLASRAGVPQTMTTISSADITRAETARAQREQAERERRRAEGARRLAEQERRDMQAFQQLLREVMDFETAADVERRRAIEEQNLILEEQLNLVGKIAEQKRLAALQEEADYNTQVEAKFKLDEQYMLQQKRAEEKVVKDRAKQQQVVGSAISNIQQLTMQSIELAKQEGMTRKEAFKSALDAWLKGFAIEQAFKGAENTINAIASYARYDYAAGTQFLAAAAGNFALAAAAGGASAAIPNVGVGGGGPEERRTETPEDTQSRNIIVNIQGMSLLDQNSIGRAIEQALSQYERRY